MIYGVTGLLGGGKSYGSVRDAAYHIKKGGVVVTNIELNHLVIAGRFGLDPDEVKKRIFYIDPDVNSDPWEWPRGDPRGTGGRRVLIIIDEAGEWFSSMESRHAIKDFASWLRQSDKRGQDVYLIVQDSSILAKQGRVLVHRWLYMRDMSKWKIPKLGWGLPYPWNQEFHRIEFDQTGRNMQGRYIHMRDKEVFRMYSTSAMFGNSAVQSTGYNPYEDLEDVSCPKASSPPYNMAAMIVANFSTLALLKTLTAVFL